MSSTLILILLNSMTFDELKPFLDWLQANPLLGSLATFVISIAESLAVIGLLIPGTVVMSAIGVFIGTGVLPAAPVIGCAIAGAIVGDGLSYWLGHHFHEHIRDIWPFKRYPKLLAKGEAYFSRYGGMSVFIGRFVGPVRPIIPVIAGMMSMSPARFLVANITSAIGWAIVYMAPGIFLGAVSLQLAPHAVGRLLMLLLIVIVILWLIYFIVRYAIRIGQQFFSYLFQRLWYRMDGYSGLRQLKLAIQDPSRPESYWPLVLTVTILSFATLFAVLAYYVNLGSFADYNYPVLNLFRNLRTPAIDQYLIAITFIASLPVLLMMHLALLVWFAVNKWWRTTFYWFIAGILTLTSTFFLKALIHAPKPIGLHLPTLGFSFPSAKISISVALFTTLGMLIARTQHKYRYFIASIVTLMTIAIIVSRLYLGADWLTDMIGGILLGLTCAFFVLLLYDRAPPEPIAAKGIVLVVSIALLLPWAWVMHRHYAQALQSYAISWPTYTMDAQAWWTLQIQPQDIYRKNHLGKPVQLFNVQWSGNLLTIEQDLMRKGWQKAPKTNIINIINRIAASKESKVQQEPSPFPLLYKGKRPALTMAKLLTHPTRLVVLRLWDANLTLNNGETPLWLGNISYQKASSFLPSLSLKKAPPEPKITLAPAMDVLETDLGALQWEQKPKPNLHCIEKVIDPDCHNHILLIRPAAKNKPLTNFLPLTRLSVI